jgi:hypothetical protein
VRNIPAVYFVVGLLTFGYSYNADYVVPAKGSFARAEELNSTGALLAAMAWPLYWSAKAFSGFRPPHFQRIEP